LFVEKHQAAWEQINEKSIKVDLKR
jgi:hypothetical protein